MYHHDIDLQLKINYCLKLKLAGNILKLLGPNNFTDNLAINAINRYRMTLVCIKNLKQGNAYHIRDLEISTQVAKIDDY